MPFDMNPVTTAAATVQEALTTASTKGKTLAERRAALLAATSVAAEEGYGPIQWRDLALALADVVPVPRAPAAPIDPDAGEWCEYTPAQRKGRGASFHPGRTALFRFANGELVRVNLSHKTTLDQPDWAKASRVAVMFYKARRSRNFLRLVGEKPGCSYITHAEDYADTCSVPVIVSAVDETRSVEADVDKANAHTLKRREGPAYLSELVDIAADLGGDWAGAWRAARAATYRALDRQKLRQERAMDAAILAS